MCTFYIVHNKKNEDQKRKNIRYITPLYIHIKFLEV